MMFMIDYTKMYLFLDLYLLMKNILSVIQNKRQNHLESKEIFRFRKKNSNTYKIVGLNHNKINNNLIVVILLHKITHKMILNKNKCNNTNNIQENLFIKKAF